MIVKKKKKKKKRKKTRLMRLTSLETGADEPFKTVMIEASKETLMGKYCNVAMIHHTELEFCMDFIWNLGNQQLLASRVITSPQHAKKLYRALKDNIEKYENDFGKIVTER